MTSYIEQWNAMFQDQDQQQANMSEIELYYTLETNAYEKILAEPNKNWQGTFSELKEEFGFRKKSVIFTGFLEGLNASLKEKIDLNNLEADWLYNIDAWNDIIDPEKQQEMLYEWRQSKIARSDKIGRNEPCPCGSGKKYKRCCGKN